ncbi:MAG TPA: hypothetical protein VMA37_13270 [Acetobacteraceae bacterium]|nr:hypothetical protein [Acetobacteraceae bacterium]
MFGRFALPIAAIALLGAGSAYADGLKPIEAQSFTLGRTTGIVYYTVEPTGFRVVATLQSGGTETVVRFIATLTPEQSITLSSPRDVDAPAIEVRLVRHGDQLFVDDGEETTSATTIVQATTGP